MKNSTMRWMIAAAALVVAAGSASAQTYTARIPMAFRVGDAKLAKGSYEFQVTNTGNAIIKVTNRDTRDSVLMVSALEPAHPGPRASAPTLAFECAGTACAMTRLSSGASGESYRIRVRKLPNVEARRTEVVTLAMTRVR